MKFIPHEYQQKTIEEAYNHDRIIAFDCGLGKTATSLMIIRNLIADGESKGALVIAPLRPVRTTWPMEISKWDNLHLRYQILHDKTRKAKFLKTNARIFLINYDNLRWLSAVLGKMPIEKWPFDTVIYDEITRMKNPGSKRFRSWRSKVPKFKRRIGLTGTPASEGLLDLFGQVFCVDAGQRFGSSITQFKQDFFYPVDHYGYKLAPTKVGKMIIRKRVADLVIQADAKDYLDIPPCNWHEVSVPLPPNLMDEYTVLEKQFLLEMNSIEIEAFNAASLMGKSLQFASGAIYYENDKGAKEVLQVHDYKVQALKKLVKSINSPVIVVYNYVHELERIKKEFPYAVILSSGMTLEQEQSIQVQWNRGQIQMLLCHPASAGHGLNLQAGQHLIWFTLNWSFELFYQMNKRIDRQGQKKPTNIYALLVPDTVDEVVCSALESKDTSQRGLLESIKAYRESKYPNGVFKPSTVNRFLGILE